ncbi:MAG: helix-turn-helix transcriptional regulator [Rubrivivax sp.]
MRRDETPVTPAPGFGVLLRRWRERRRYSQLALAHTAEVSPRHLSWLENHKSAPSRAMVLRLAEHLEVPLRERNAWLRAAGFAPLYREQPLDATVLASVQALLDAHLPALAIAVDRHWQLVAANAMLPALLQGVDPALLAPPVNVLRIALHPRGLAPAIANLPAWRGHVLQRLRRQAEAAGDPVLQALHDELAAWGPADDEGLDADAVALPLRLHTPAGELSLISTLTVFGAPHDIQLSELALETFLPADAATAEALRRLAASLS